MLDIWGKRAIVLVAVLFAVRAYVMTHTGLGDPEAYYWAWSQHPDWSYYDHPAMTAWLIWLATSLGGDTVFMTRLPALLLFVANCYLLYTITVRLFHNPQAGFWALLFFNISPVFAIGTIQMVPDVPVVFFWLLFVHYVIRALDEERPVLWYIVGALLGLALLSKYMAVILAPSTLLMLLWHPEYRKHLRQPHIYLGGLLGLAVFSPVFIWNYLNDFASFSFHLVERHETSKAFNPTFALLALVGQIAYYSPIMWGITIHIAVTASKRVLSAGEPLLRIPFWFGVPPLLFFTFITFWTEDSEPHWTSLAFLTLFMAWGWYYVNGTRFFRRLSLVAVAITLPIIAAFYVQLVTPLIPVKEAKYDVTNIMHGWDEAEQAILREYRALPGEDNFVMTHHYLLGGQLSFALKGDAPVYVISPKHDAYDFFKVAPPKIGANFIYVDDDRFKRPPERYYVYDRRDEPVSVDVYRHGKYARTFYLYRIYGYRGEKTR